MSVDIHVGACTPLVSRGDRHVRRGSVPGQIGAHIARVTSPCSWLTALTAPDERSASAVMLNCEPWPLS